MGTRIGGDVPKQLIPIAGKPILEHSIAAMQRSPLIDEILVVMAASYLEQVWALVESGGYDKVSQILPGAEIRNGSTAITLAALGDQECNVLLHDAARPLVSQEIIAANVAALVHHLAVHTAIPSTDTVIKVDQRSRVADVLPRHLLRRAQTPQSFRLSTIRAAYAKAARDPDFTATDDSTVVLRYLPGVVVVVVPGDERNLKVTEPIDLSIAEMLLSEARSRPT